MTTGNQTNAITTLQIFKKSIHISDEKKIKVNNGKLSRALSSSASSGKGEL